MTEIYDLRVSIFCVGTSQMSLSHIVPIALFIGTYTNHIKYYCQYMHQLRHGTLTAWGGAAQQLTFAFRCRGTNIIMFDKLGVNKNQFWFHHKLGIIVFHSSISQLIHTSILRLELIKNRIIKNNHAFTLKDCILRLLPFLQGGGGHD
jgi:hypothetical protein